MPRSRLPGRQGLYDPMHEHDACGVGFVVNMKGVKSHTIIEQGLQILANLTHRGACGCDPLTGDGAGILSADARRVPAEGVRDARHHLAARRRVRRRDGVSARARRRAKRVPGDVREGRPRGRPAPARVAARAGRRDQVRLARPRVDAGDPPDLHRARPHHARHRRARAQALRHPEARRASGARVGAPRLRVLLRAEPLDAAPSTTRACCCPIRSRSSTRT